MKNHIKVIILLLILVLTIIFREQITNFIVQKILFKDDVIMGEANDYQLNYAYAYVQETDDFYAKDRQQILNILYTGLNHGVDYFYFYCDYEKCEEDVSNIIDAHEANNINNFVHPYNSYRKLYVSISSYHKVRIDVDKAYTDEFIQAINQKIDTIMNEILTSNMTTKQKIKSFHNYIAKATKYDNEYIDKGLNDIDHPSHKAIGPLFYNKALCGGYSDSMAIFLNKLGLPNYRISSEKHVWNLVKVDNEWLHIDLTWDDPGNDIILDSFLLIPTEKLQSFNTGHHIFDTQIYKEA